MLIPLQAASAIGQGRLFRFYDELLAARGVTAAQVLLELLKECREGGVTVAMARLESVRAQDAFERFKLYDALPREYVFHSVDEAVRKLAK